MSSFERIERDVHDDPGHPSVEQLHAFAVGQLTETDSVEVERHLASCTHCHQLLETSPNDSFVALLQQGDSLSLTGPSLAVGLSRSPRSVPGYALLELLGVGGMGVVWKTRQERLNRLVALKRLRWAGVASAEMLARFRREAESVARLHHANILQIYEVGEHDGEPYLALEYVGGGSLAQKLTAGPLVPGQAAALLETLARAMHHAHEHGIIHRDLKPDNILFADDGSPKISDFGLAKQLDAATAHTQTGAILGTPSYMAPEQAAAGEAPVLQSASLSPAIGAAADVYALGAILYEMLTGVPPFRGATVLDTLAQVREREPVPPRQLQPSVPRDVQTICLKCLNKDPRRRYGSAWDLAEDLRRFLAGEPIRARPIGRLERLLKWMRRKPYRALLAGVVSLIPVAAIVALLWHNDRLRREIGRADAAERDARENYKKSRQTILSILGRYQNWSTTGKKAGLEEGIIQDSLAYVETVLDAGDRDDPQVRSDVAELRYQIAQIQASTGQRESARDNFTKALTLWEQLTAQCPEVSAYRAQLANCYRTMHFFVSGDDRQKIAWLEKAVSLNEGLVRLNPDDDLIYPLALAQCQHDLASLLLLGNRLPEAEEHFDRSIGLYDKILGRHPDDRACKLGLADNYTNLGLVYLRTGRTEMAENAFQQADALLEPLMKEGFLSYMVAVSRSYLALNWGNLYLEKGQIDKALASYDSGLPGSEAILTEEPNYAPAREIALKLHGSKANAYDALKRFAEAATEWQRVVELAEAPADRQYRLRWCLSLARGGDFVRAAAEAGTLAAEPSGSPDLLYDCACVLALSGRTEKAVALLRKLQNDGYFDKPANFQNLRTDEDLDPLRRRDDFIRLLKELRGAP